MKQHKKGWKKCVALWSNVALSVSAAEDVYWLQQIVSQYIKTFSHCRATQFFILNFWW